MNKNIKICLINPQSPFLIQRNVFPNLGLLTLSSVFKQTGYTNIKFVDLIGRNDDVTNIKADIFFMYVATPNYDAAKDLSIQLRRNNIISKIVVGGPAPTVSPEEFPWADCIVMGDGELASLRILNEYPNVHKYYYEERIKDLDTIPFADRDIIDIRDYANNYKLRGIPTTTIVTSRGCSWGKCSFCSRYTNGIRYRSAQNIFDEVKQIKEKYGISGFMFFDDELPHNKKRLKEFCKLVTPLDIKWRCLARVDSLNANTIHTMQDAGMVEIALGIESADQEILKNINKNIDIYHAEKICHLIRECHIDLKELFIIGLPGESPESIEAIDKFVEVTRPSDVDFTLLSVYPGSDIYNHPEKYDIKFNKKCKAWYKGKPKEYNNVCTISTSKMSFEDIVKARNYLEEKYKPKEKLMSKEELLRVQ